MKLLILYLLYYDNSYNFFLVFQIRVFANKECNGIHKFVFGKQDCTKVEDTNLEKK